MPTSAAKSNKKSYAQDPRKLAENFGNQIFETTRRSIAMRRFHPGAICRWRRAARTGPNSSLAIVMIWHPGQDSYQTEVWEYEKVERLAAEVSDQEVFEYLAKRLGVEARNQDEQS